MPIMSNIFMTGRITWAPFDNDHARLAWPPASAPSRRAVLAAGALGIAGASLAAAPASAATAVGPAPERVAKSAKRPGFAGANRPAFATMLSGRPPTPPTGVRWYTDDTQYPNTTGYARGLARHHVAANLDWYGCDLYDSKALDLSVYHELNTFREYVNSLPGSVKDANWPINLPECNSRYLKKGVSTVRTSGPTGFRRSDVFHYAWSWLQDIGPGGPCSGLLGFWGGTGGEGAPRPPVNKPEGPRGHATDGSGQFTGTTKAIVASNVPGTGPTRHLAGGLPPAPRRAARPWQLGQSLVSLA